MGLVKSTLSAQPETPAPAVGAPELLLLLAGEDAPLRRFAAAELQEYPEAAVQLAAHLAGEPDKATREAVLISLLAIGSDEACGALLSLLPGLHADRAGLRNEVIEALQQMPADTAPLVAVLCRDPDARMRIFGVNILCGMRNALVPEWLRGMLGGETHPNVAAALIEALADIGTPAAIPDLQALPARFPNQRFLSFAVAMATHRIACEAGAL